MKKTIFCALFLFLFFSAVDANERSSQNKEIHQDHFLDRYRMHIASALTVVSTPNRSHDAYRVFTAVKLNNGLHLFCSIKEYHHAQSAEDERKTQEKNYSTRGVYCPGTEVFIDYTYEYRFITILNKKIQITDHLFYARPMREKFSIYNNETHFFSTLPRITDIQVLELVEIDEGWLWDNVITYYQVEMRLTDGSIWITDSSTTKPSLDWNIGDHIFVCLNEKDDVLMFNGKDCTEHFKAENRAKGFQFVRAEN